MVGRKKQASEDWTEPKIPLLDKLIVWAFIILAMSVPAIIVGIEELKTK